jgi:hypothetical protein
VNGYSVPQIACKTIACRAVAIALGSLSDFFCDMRVCISDACIAVEEGVEPASSHVFNIANHSAGGFETVQQLPELLRAPCPSRKSGILDLPTTCIPINRSRSIRDVYGVT